VAVSLLQERGTRQVVDRLLVHCLGVVTHHSGLTVLALVGGFVVFVGDSFECSLVLNEAAGNGDVGDAGEGLGPLGLVEDDDNEDDEDEDDSEEETNYSPEVL